MDKIHSLKLSGRPLKIGHPEKKHFPNHPFSGVHCLSVSGKISIFGKAPTFAQWEPWIFRSRRWVDVVPSAWIILSHPRVPSLRRWKMRPGEQLVMRMWQLVCFFLFFKLFQSLKWLQLWCFVGRRLISLTYSFDVFLHLIRFCDHELQKSDLQ